MRHDRLIRPIALIVTTVALSARATPTIELSAAPAGVQIDVSDDAPLAIDLGGDAIVPVRWTREGRTRATLPLRLLPGVDRPRVDVVVAGQAWSIAIDPATPRVRIDAATYAAAWRAGSAGRWTAIAATAALTLLLASRVPRRGPIAAGVVAVAWTAGLLTFAATRPDVDRTDFDRTDVDGVTWLRARRATVARLWVDELPIVESASHLRSLAPRIDVDADGRATLGLTLAKGARVAVKSSSNVR